MAQNLIDTVISHIDTVIYLIDTVISHIDIITHIDTDVSHIDTVISLIDKATVTSQLKMPSSTFSNHLFLDLNAALSNLEHFLLGTTTWRCAWTHRAIYPTVKLPSITSGRAMQVDPIKPTLKAPGYKRLIQKYD